MNVYTVVRNVHLVLASFSLPFLLMYGASAVQMSHGSWFQMRQAVVERQVALTPGQADARAVAREIMDREPSVRGELNNIQANAKTIGLRIVLPGTVHEVQYDPASGAARIKTSVAGFMGMLNRLHHAAGLWHELPSTKAWALAVALVSASLLLIGATGIYMWLTRRPERRIGILLLGANLLFAIVMLTMMRVAGP
jgi:hypothetical protein